MKRVSCLLFLVMVILLSLMAWPEDTAKTGRACIYCHVNESGVGPLTPAGIYYKENGTLEGFSDSLEIVDDDISFDARAVTMLEYEDDPAFSLMTAKISSRFPLGSNSHIYLSNNLGEFRRAYIYNRIGDLSTTFGIQETDFGLRIYDHTALLEDELGFGTDRIDIGVHAKYTIGMATISGSVLNGAYPIPFRADKSGISAYTARLSLSPLSFATFGISSYYNQDDIGGLEKTLFAGIIEMRKGPILYSGEHLLGRWRGKLIRGYHNALHIGLTQKIALSMSAEFLDLDRELSKSATYRGQLGLGYRINPYLSTLATYSHRWDPNEDKGRFDLYFIGDY